MSSCGRHTAVVFSCLESWDGSIRHLPLLQLSSGNLKYPQIIRAISYFRTRHSKSNTMISFRSVSWYRCRKGISLSTGTIWSPMPWQSTATSVASTLRQRPSRQSIAVQTGATLKEKLCCVPCCFWVPWPTLFVSFFGMISMFFEKCDIQSTRWLQMKFALNPCPSLWASDFPHLGTRRPALAGLMM